MKKWLIFGQFLISSFGLLAAQEPVLGGSQSQTLLVPNIGKEYNPNDPLQEQSVKAYMMPPRRQGGSRASAYYAVASLMEYYANVNSDYKINLSPDFIYFNLAQKESKDTLMDAFNFVQQKGTVSAALVPFGAKEVTAEVNMAKKYKIKEFICLFRPTTRETQRIYEVRKALTRGNPVIVRMNTPSTFLALGANDRMWEAPVGNVPTVGQIALIIVGFDEHRRAFEVFHSGGSQWANRGYIWIKYDDLLRFAIDGFVILPNE